MTTRRDDDPVTDTRRQFLRRGAIAAAAVGSGSVVNTGMAQPGVPESWTRPGGDFSNYGSPVAERNDVIRWITQNPAASGDGVSWTPMHAMEGTITPNGLHFERHHNGIPALAAAHYRLTIDGLVRSAVTLDLDRLHTYPLQSRISFIECGGNSNALWNPSPVQAQAGYLHGLASCAEWTGVRLADVLQPLGLQPSASWLIAEGYDSSGLSISLPLAKALDDTLLALYQNGEPLRAANGYPLRLLVPGWEGVTHVKWLKRLHVADRPAMSRFDTVSYTERHADGSSTRFSHEMGVKSIITRPSPQTATLGHGSHQISGLAWSGAGHVAAVDVSVDGGRHWRSAHLQAPVLDRAFTRFRLPWQWQGEPSLLMSRARDSAGSVQPDRDTLLQQQGPGAYYHFNGIVGWSVSREGAIRHAYA